MRYKGFDVLTFPTGFGGGPTGLGAVYYIYRDGLMRHHGVLQGAFDDPDAALIAAEAAAKAWINAHADDPASP